MVTSFTVYASRGFKYVDIHINTTFEEVDHFFSMVTCSRESKRCIHVIRNLVEAHADVSRVVIVQDTVVKPPVLVSLLKYD